MKKIILLMALSLAAVAPAMAKNPNAVNMRVNAVCSSMAQSFSYQANGDAVFEQCVIGARTAYQGNDKKCQKNLATFNRQAETMRGAVRAEYVAFKEAYRAGCNVGKSSREAGY